MILLIPGGLRLPAEGLHHRAVALRLRVAGRAVRVHLHARGRIRRPVRVILILHVGLPGDVRRRREGRLAAGGRVRAVHAVAVDLIDAAAVRRQGRSLYLRGKAATENTPNMKKNRVRRFLPPAFAGEKYLNYPVSDISRLFIFPLLDKFDSSGESP